MKVHFTSRASLRAAALVAGLIAIVVPAWGQVINEDLKLLASDRASGDQFGFSIAIDNGVVAVGAPSDDDNGRNSGSAYLLDASTGAQIAKLLPSDGAAFDLFGTSIAIDDGVVAVGALKDDDNGRDSGSAYLFDASTGAQIAKLLPSDGAAWALFGTSIACDNGVVAVAGLRNSDKSTNRGWVYLFDVSTGAQIAKLLPNDGVPGYRSAPPIAMDNGIVAVGMAADDDNGTRSGSAYLFDASTGAQIAKLLPADGEAADRFGYSVSISGDTVVIGALEDDDNALNAGAAYVFTGSEGVWTEQAKLLRDDGARGFGFSVSISGDTTVIWGGQDNGSRSGSAYVFARRGGVWTGRAKLLLADGANGHAFGFSVSTSGETVVIGMPCDDDNGRNSGSAYVIDIANRASFCDSDGDVDGDRQVNSVDSGLVQAAFGSTDEQDVCHYDLDCDGQINPVDSGIVQSLFGACQPPGEVLSCRADPPNRRSKSRRRTSVSKCMNLEEYQAIMQMYPPPGMRVRDPAWIWDGDVDGDGQVNPVDAGLVQAAFGSTDEQDMFNYDMDCDGKINSVDVGIVQSLFGTCEAPRAACP